MIDTCRKALIPIFRTSALVAGLVSGYYHRVFAGTCVGAGGTYLCSGGAIPATATQALASPSLTVTTSPGFGLTTNAGNGLELLATNGISFVDDNVSTITGYNAGVFANNQTSGSLSLQSNGTIAGGTSYGILAVNAGSDLIITATNVYGGDYGIVAYNNGSGRLSLTTSGVVEGGTGGILAVNYGSALVISVNDVYGGNAGIQAYNGGSGDLSITASGEVIGGGFGITVFNGGRDLTISANDVYGYLFGIYVSNYGTGVLTITTSGSVAGSTAGIYGVNFYGTSSYIHVDSSSHVQGYGTGIFVGSANGTPIAITVDGQVSNLSGNSSAPAIVAYGGPVTMNLNSGSRITGNIQLDDYNDIITLAGTLNGSAYMEGGEDVFIQVGGSFLTGSADGGAGDDTLGFNNMGTMDGSLQGTKYLSFENLGIYGGSTELTGTWDFSSGVANIYSGNLYVNGRLVTTMLTVKENGLLGGTGAITGNVRVFGTLSPGNSIGKIKVDGSVDFMPGSIYATEIAANGTNDLLSVSGSVSISGATLSASLPQGLYADGTTWQLISAGGGINGRFSSIRTNLKSYIITINPYYSGGTMGLVVDRIPYSSFGTTPNEEEVGTALNSLLPNAEGSMGNLIMAMDFSMNPAQISATLNGLSPEIYTSFGPSGLMIADMFDRIAAFRQQEAPSSGETSGEGGPLWGVWGKALGSNIEQDGDGQTSGFKLESAGVVLGLDRGFGNNLRAGVMLGHASSDLSWDIQSQTGSVNSKHIALYGNADYDAIYLNGRLGYTSLDNSGARNIETPVLNTIGTANFDSHVLSGTFSGGYDFIYDDFRFGPTFSLGYMHLDQDGFSEAGAGDFSIRADQKSSDMLSALLGVCFKSVIKVGNWNLKPDAQLGIVLRTWDDAENLDVSFADYPSAGFSVTGADPGESAVLTTLGITADYNNSMSLYLNGSLTMADGQDSQFLSAGVVWRF